MKGSGASLTLFLAPFGIAFTASLIATPIVRRLAWKAGLVANPAADRWHRRTVAMLGGIPVWLCTLLGVALTAGFSTDTILVVVGSTLLLALGLVDDVVQLKPNAKLSAEIVLACAVVACGYHLNWSDSPAINALVTIVWIAGITNAFNLLDNMDGLCAGVSVIAAVAFCGSIGVGDASSFAYAAALAGATLGFLRYNFNPASVFLGDCGSLFLGSTFALLSLSKPAPGQRGLVSTLIVPVLILLLPIFDTTFVTISRKLSARAASQGGRDHTSHRLVALGFSERQASLVLYSLAAVGGAVAIGLSRANIESLAVGSLLLVGLGLLATQLARVRVYGGDDFALLRGRAFTPLLIDVTYKRRIFELLLDTCLIAIGYYFAYALRFAEEFRTTYYGLFATSLPIVIACQLAGFFAAGVYRGVWRYMSIADLFTYLRGVVFGGLLTVLALVYLYRFEQYSRGVFMINAMVVGLLVVGSRLSFRWVGDLTARRRPSDARQAIICGAGDGGALLVRELRNNPRHECVPVGFLDDDPTKHRRSIMGLPVLGRIADAERILVRRKPALVIVSTAKLRPAALASLQDACKRTATPLMQMDFSISDISRSRLAALG
jgi:UDP-GlcNAc:undecaprenyl-phosphate GlcNAc-1-phosphate transferase